jgi:hypothetical protein
MELKIFLLFTHVRFIIATEVNVCLLAAIRQQTTYTIRTQYTNCNTTPTPPPPLLTPTLSAPTVDSPVLLSFFLVYLISILYNHITIYINITKNFYFSARLSSNTENISKIFLPNLTAHIYHRTQHSPKLLLCSAY